MKERAFESKHVLLAGLAAMVLAVGLFGLSACGSSSSSSESESGSAAAGGADYSSLDKVTLISTDSTSPDSAGNQWQLAFKDAVEEITGGQITVDYHGNGELGGDADNHRQLQSNDVQIDVSQPATFVSFVPEMAVFDAHMTMATYDADTIETVLNGDNEFTQQLQEAAKTNKMHILGWLQNGTYRETTSNKELRTLADFKGFQIRTMENSNHMAFWTAIGAEPTPLAFAEVYFALQNGTVDGQENATDTSTGNNFQEVQKYLCKTNHVLYANCMMISEECWEGLDPLDQQAIEEAVAQATEQIRPQIAQLDEDATKKMTDAGMEVIEYDDSFFEEIANNEGVKKLNEDLDEQTNGLLTVMQEQLAAAKA
ncbi:TRAP transporter substrate-binding protein [Paratractidigestivibacter sp.]|uniref:TRAP transporter substrate-binding protein n=1 Tax=Paratractidigestivibacter sp. TaxID=2847316 RepID=UPI002AC9727E|nr:TRAP transporter substrate-binding protein [Paratractidigestivibacter sp.]